MLPMLKIIQKKNQKNEEEERRTSRGNEERKEYFCLPLMSRSPLYVLELNRYDMKSIQLE